MCSTAGGVAPSYAAMDFDAEDQRTCVHVIRFEVIEGEWQLSRGPAQSVHDVAFFEDDQERESAAVAERLVSGGETLRLIRQNACFDRSPNRSGRAEARWTSR
jgi:hypothetical protein